MWVWHVCHLSWKSSNSQQLFSVFPIARNASAFRRLKFQKVQRKCPHIDSVSGTIRLFQSLTWRAQINYKKRHQSKTKQKKKTRLGVTRNVLEVPVTDKADTLSVETVLQLQSTPLRKRLSPGLTVCKSREDQGSGHSVMWCQPVTCDRSAHFVLQEWFRILPWHTIYDVSLQGENWGSDDAFDCQPETGCKVWITARRYCCYIEVGL